MDTRAPGSIIAGTYGARPSVETAANAAGDVFATYREASPSQRADLLQAIAAQIESDREAIIESALAETHLTRDRLVGELARTTGQLRQFASVARRGDHLGVRLDSALPDRKPTPRPDLRLRMVALGPVAVFAASNFPLAFSTAGGDTAAALAAGCPVIVKGHPAHPRTGQLVAHAVTEAVRETRLLAGVFSFLIAEGDRAHTLGLELVGHPRVKAVAFTGSRGGGSALAAAASARPVPIPVFAEMSSVNPVVVLPGALAHGKATPLAAEYVASLTLGAGQFCTNPGLIFVPAGADGDEFVASAGAAVAKSPGQPMLTTEIASAYTRRTTALRTTGDMRVLAEGRQTDHHAPAPVLLEVTARSRPFLEEVFGPCGVVIRYENLNRLISSLVDVDGQLTATIHCSDDDGVAASQLVPLLEGIAGRVLFNSWPTGVEVAHATVHGGPFPATSDSRTTSVGTLSIERFQRPVCYQNVPPELLPDALRDDNPWRLLRRIDGELRSPTRGES